MVEFKFVDLFPAADDESVQIVRLIVATNDFRSAMRLFLGAIEREVRPEEGLSARGDQQYAIRLAALHLHEVADAFNSAAIHRFFDTRMGQDGAHEFADLRRTVGRRLNQMGPLLRAVRNVAGGHYPREDILRVFARAQGDAEPVTVQTEALEVHRHLDIGDVVTHALIRDAIAANGAGVDPDYAAGAFVRELAQLQIEITKVTYWIVVAVMGERGLLGDL